MIPLEQIPDLYVGDPQEGLRQVLQHCPIGTKVTQQESLVTPGWFLYLTVPGAAAPDVTIYYDNFSVSDEYKAAAIRNWLTTLCASVAQLTSSTWGPLPHQKAIVAKALSAARSVPSETPVVRRQDAGDRLIANLQARRAAG